MDYQSRQDESGAVRWPLIAWFLGFIVLYAGIFGLVITLTGPRTPEAGVELVRLFGIGGLALAWISAKLATRRRHQKPRQ